MKVTSRVHCYRCRRAVKNFVFIGGIPACEGGCPPKRRKVRRKK